MGVVIAVEENLVLRELQPDDAASLFQLVRTNLTHLTKLGDYTEYVQMSESEHRDHLASQTNSTTDYGLYLDDRLIGCVSLIQHQPDIFGLGYWIDSANANRGYATKAVKALIDFALHQCNASEIWAGITPTNEASIRLVERLGFKLARQQASHLSYKLTF